MKNEETKSTITNEELDKIFAEIEVDRIVFAYEKKFGDLPMLMYCYDTTPENPIYIDMLKMALERGTPVNDDDLNKYFPGSDDPNIII
jgi:hypothetical protein